MNGLNTHTHRNGLQTEVDAFVKASKRMESTKSKIIFEIGCAGENGLTPDEFVENYGGLINTVRRRFTDLWKEGKIKHHPTLLERKNRAGNNCVTWVIGKDEKSVSIKSKREWVGLTDEEIKHIEETTTCLENESWLRNLTRNLEAKLKEKNNV
jgi:hypothetical protein